MAEELHFLLIPLMSQSHIIPLTHCAISLARHGARVSIVTTPLNAARHKPSPSIDNLKIQMIPLPFPCREAGLPEGYENTDSLTSPEFVKKFFHACEMLQAPLEDLIHRNLLPKPHCIVATAALGWAHRIAEKFHIPAYVFETVSCFNILCDHKLSQLLQKGTGVYSHTAPFRVPDIPHEIEFTKLQLPSNATNGLDNEFRVYLADQLRESRDSARAVVVNSFWEVEPWYVDGLRKAQGKPLWCIGPVSLYYSKGISDMAAIDGLYYCRKWLHSMKPKSVVYACFGSLSRISAQQLKEIGLGLEASNRPFIWVIRNQDCSSEVVNWLAEERFEERVEGRGLVIRGWAPQVPILSHTAVGGFLTHCGWNSTLEGASAAVTMITWPMSSEQFYNEKFIVDVLGIGLKIGVKKFGELVEWNRVRIGIKNLMDESEAGMERRRRAEELAALADRAVKEGGSSYTNLSKLIQDVVMQLDS